MNLHAHIDSVNVGCDGRIDRSWISRPHDGQDEFDFKAMILGLVVSTHAKFGTLNVSNERLQWYESTEEGHRNVDVEFCEDACGDMSHYRDHRAESMGY